jgi:hypothetical protein
MAPRSAHRLLLSTGLVLAAVALLLVLAGDDALAALPALLALWLPASGRYVGEQRLARLARRRTPRPLRARGTGAPRLARARRALPRGGRLIAARLAWRGPPARAVSAH